MTPGEVAALAAQIDSLHEDVREVKQLAKQTNGRVRTLELWQAKVEGAKWAIGWAPPLLTSLFSSAVSVALYALFVTH